MNRVFELKRALLFSEEYPWTKPLTPIPHTFTGWKDYLGYFQLPLVENSRVELLREASSAGTKDKPFVRAKKIRNLHMPRFIGELQGSSIFLTCEKPKLLQKGHVLLISTWDPNGYQDPWRDCGWAVVEYAVKDATEKAEVFGCVTWQFDIESEESDLFVAVIGTIIPTERIMKSLVHVELHTKSELNMGIASSIEMQLFGAKPTPLQERTLVATRGSLNHSQTTAVERVLNCIYSSGGIVLIQGPPGTGKTTTIVNLLMEFRRLHSNDRTLVCAPTNIAMVEIAKKLVSKNAYSTIDIAILGSESKVASLLREDQKHFNVETRIRLLAVLLANFSRFLQSFGTVCRVLSGKIKGKDLDVTKLHADLQLILTKNIDEAEISALSALTAASCKFTDELRRLAGSNLNADLGLESLDSAPLRLFYDSERIVASASIGQFSQSAANSFTLLVNKYIHFEDKSMGSLSHSNKHCKFFMSCLSAYFVKRAWVCFSTINGTMSYHLENTVFSMAVCDEAVQALEVETTCLLKNGLKTLVLVGDTKQLQGTVFSEDCKTVGYATSLFARLERNGHPVQMLDTQYRMHPDIAGFSSRNFYNGQIRNGSNVGKLEPWHTDFAVLQFFDHSGSRSTINKSGSSHNQTECELICLQLYKFLEHTTAPIEIGVVCPFTAQKELLQKMVESLPRHNARITVNTIDGFQGQERDIIILSLTKSGTSGQFINDPCRMNVALTRAKSALWVFGDKNAFLDNPGMWKLFGQYCGNIGVVEPFQMIPENSVRQIQFIQSIRKSANAMEDSSHLLGRKAYQIWRIIAADSVLKEIVREKKDQSCEKFGLVLDELRLGRLSCSRRPYLKSGIAGKLFFERRIDNTLSLIWTIEIRNATQAICLISLCPSGSVSKLWKSFSIALQNVTEEYVTACANITYHHNHIAFPQSGLDSLVRTDSNAVLRTVSDSTKIFDVTSSIDLLAESFSDRKSRISLPYLLDCFQEDAINVKQTAVIIGRGGTGKTSVLARKLLMAHQTAIETESTLRSQLFVTQSSMLVRRIEAEYKSLLETFHATSGLPKWSEIPKEVALFLKAPKFMSFFDLLQDVDIIAGVPESRLFWTDFDESKFDQLVLLQGSSKALRFKNSRITVNNHYVNFERFDNVYYSYASFDLRKSYSAAFLFTQIMSVIKNVDSNGVKTVIGRDEFLAITTSTIVSRDRHSIWDFYLRYEQEKRSRFQLDMLDIMANILSRCSSSKLPLQDIIFIDEVQDLMPCQLFLFDHLRDENTGVVCSGDQAQAITAGMDFRFSKLKAELYRKYKVPPVELHLTLNYRTAEPIMKLSNQVLDVIRYFFPNDLDSIPQEQSSSSAVSAKPRIFENEDRESLEYLFSESPNFSAEQAIIVPSAKMKSVLNEKIQSFRGNRNLVPTILTVLEAKGLEFDDIILFNLFSNCDSVHRVLLDFDSTKRLSDGLIPEFQMAKHGFLCHELKQLYVAITRAKKRLLVIDNSESRSSYMRILGDLIEYTTVDKEKPFSTGLQSTNKAWEARGFEFKASNLLEDAYHAFERAGNLKEASFVKIEILLKNYEKLNDLDAAKEAVILYIEFGELKKAADLQFNCGLYEKAAELYEKLSNPSRIMLCYSEGRLFDKLFKTLQHYATVLGPTICDLQYEFLAGNLSKTSALFYKCCDAIESDLVALGLLERSFEGIGFEKRRLIDAYVSRNALVRSLDFFIRSRPDAPLFECAIKVASEFPSEWPSLQPQYGALFKEGAIINVIDAGLKEKMNWKKLTVRLVHSKGSNYFSTDFSYDLEPSQLYKLLEKASLHPICGILFTLSNGFSSVDAKHFVSSERWNLLPPFKYASNVFKLSVEDIFISLAKQGAHRDSRVLFASRNRSFETVFTEKDGKRIKVKRYYFISYLEEALEAGKVEINDVLNALVYHQKLDQAKSMALKNPYELKKVFIRNDDFFLEQFKEQSQMHAKLYCINSLEKLNLRYKCIEAVSGVQDAFSAVKELPDDPKPTKFLVNFVIKKSLVSDGLSFLLSKDRLESANMLLDGVNNPRYFESSVSLKTRLWGLVVDKFLLSLSVSRETTYISTVETCLSKIGDIYFNDKEYILRFMNEWKNRMSQNDGNFSNFTKSVVVRPCIEVIFKVFDFCLSSLGEVPQEFVEIVARTLGVSEMDYIGVISALASSGNTVYGRILGAVMEDALTVHDEPELWDIWNEIQKLKSRCLGWNDNYMKQLEDAIENSTLFWGSISKMPIVGIGHINQSIDGEEGLQK